MANRSKVDQIEQERPGAYTRSDRVTSAEAERKNYQTTRPSEYTKSQAVLDAEAALKDYQAQRPGDYTKSQAVLDAEAAIKNYQAQRPGDYESQYGAQIDSLLEQIQNRKAFAYDFNADPLYQQYKNQYTKLGSDAAANAAADAAALTGGYGSSYTASAAAQANQQYLTQLNNVIPDLYQVAYERYQGEGNDLYNQLSALQNQDEMQYGRWQDRYANWADYLDYLTNRADSEYQAEYGRYQDKYSNWADYLDYLTDRADTAYSQDYGEYSDNYNRWQDYLDYLTEREDTAYNQDYGEYSDNYTRWQQMLDYYYGDYRDMVSDEQWQQEFAESQRQFNEQLAFDKQQYADSLAASAASAGGSGSSAGRSSSRSSRSSKSSKSSSDDTVQYWISKIDPMAGSGQSYDSSTRAGKVGIANMINNGYKKGNLTKAQAKSIAAHYGISID